LKSTHLSLRPVATLKNSSFEDEVMDSGSLPTRENSLKRGVRKKKLKINTQAFSKKLAPKMQVIHVLPPRQTFLPSGTRAVMPKHPRELIIFEILLNR